MRDRLILHYSRLDWKVDRDRRWTWCGRFMPLERVTDCAYVVTCQICRSGVLADARRAAERAAGPRRRQPWDCR